MLICLFHLQEFLKIKKKKLNLTEQKALEDLEFEDDENEENEEEEENKIETKEEIVKKEKEFLNNENNMIQKIIQKIKILPLQKNEQNEKIERRYSHLRTITSLNRFCYGIMKLREYFKKTKYEDNKITDDDIVNTVFEMLFRDDTENLEISKCIKNILLV